MLVANRIVSEVSCILTREGWDTAALRMALGASDDLSRKRRALENTGKEVKRLRHVIDGTIPDPIFQVLVFHPFYGTLKIDVKAISSFLEVKDKIQLKTGISSWRQRIFSGRLCPQDHQTLAEFKIHGSSVLRLSFSYNHRPLPRLIRVFIAHRLRSEETASILYVEETMLFCELRDAWEEMMLSVDNPNFNTLSRCPIFADLSYSSIARRDLTLFANMESPYVLLNNEAPLSSIVGTRSEASLFFLSRPRQGTTDIINVFRPNGTRFELCVRPFTTFEHVKHLIQQLLGIPPWEQQLTFDGQQVQDDCTLMYFHGRSLPPGARLVLA